MPFPTLTNNQRISETQTFIVITALALKQPTKDDPQGSKGFVNQSPSPR